MVSITSLNETKEVSYIDNCKWSDLICHKSLGKCTISKSNGTSSLITHTFFNTPFSIDRKGGLKYHDTIFKKSVKCSEFTDDKRCLIQTGWFDESQFEHLLQYRITSIIDYWWIIKKFLSLWDGVRGEIELYPMSKTALDVLLPITETNSCNDFLFLRPVHFSTDPKYYYSSIATLMSVLLQNHDISDFSSNRYVTYCKNREYIKTINFNLEFCKCVLTLDTSKNNLGRCIYDIYGKNMYFHYVCCVPVESRNAEWFDFVKCLVKFRYDECLHNKEKSTHRNQLIKSKKRWFESLIDDERQHQINLPR